MNHSISNAPRLTRRLFLRLAALAGAAVWGLERLFNRSAFGQNVSGLPLPDEPVEATLKRLFGQRSIVPAAGKIKIELPQIAEDGSNVPITVDAAFPMNGPSYASHLYLISDKNRRPMLAKFSFTPESGRAFIATSIRLATTTDVRAVVEMSDGALYSASRHVRVTISGCDLPPQG